MPTSYTLSLKCRSPDHERNQYLIPRQASKHLLLPHSPISLQRSSPGRQIKMACVAAVSASVAAVAPVSQLGESRILSRQGAVLVAPKSLSRKLVVNRSRVVMSASPQKEQNLAGLTTVALLAAAVIPEIAEAAQPVPPNSSTCYNRFCM
ncbi:hypothetical protein R1flu_000043 [Riccia fluitans]|uniref:Uncharacterized protein n=1 Tax=Riccia fluitans TaxID=41844 RepID=A0ABD1XZA8_9MARC